MTKQELIQKLFTNGGHFADYVADKKAGTQNDLCELLISFLAERLNKKNADACVKLIQLSGIMNKSQLDQSLESLGIIVREGKKAGGKSINLDGLEF